MLQLQVNVLIANLTSTPYSNTQFLYLLSDAAVLTVLDYVL